MIGTSLFLFLLALISFSWRAEGFLGLNHVGKLKDIKRILHNHAPLPLQMASSDSKSQKKDDDSFQLPNRSRKSQHKDTVIVGAGLAGLSTALYLSQLDPQRQITILDRMEHDVDAKKKTTIGSFAAAGMLAPQSERLPQGHLLDLCLASRRIYPDFVDLVESLAKESGEDGAKYLMPNEGSTSLDPWSVGYMASGGFLAPAFAGDTVATWAPPTDEAGSAIWLDDIQVRELEPNLHPDVVGGWWFPEDASVDARRLTCSLYAACVAAGVQFLCGKGYEVTSMDLTGGECHGLWLQNGKYFKTKTVLVANGAWMRNLLPVPIEPHKGQSLSLRMPTDRPPILRRVLFAQDSYIVPKADGHIIIGATVEAGSFDGNVTPAGLLHILSHALQLVPALKDLPVVETWAGLRPTTPDKGPILGKSPWKNLFLAGGYWRNGVLLAPKTAQLLACLVTGTALSATDKNFLEVFSWDRFTAKGGGAKLAANARYAASMHPIHSRVSGAGVAAAVGTELGSYSTASAAKEERQKERNALWDSDDNAFERAAALGKRDALSFTMGDDKDIDSRPASGSSPSPSPVSFPASTTMTTSTDEDKSDSRNDLASRYATIKENKAKQDLSLPDMGVVGDKPDPGFRVYHVDSETGEKRKVPPYTDPAAFLQSIKKEFPIHSKESEKGESPLTAKNGEDDNARASNPAKTYSEKTYDGYQDILEANGAKTRAEELAAMKKAREKNRLGQSAIDESKIGAKKDHLSLPLPTSEPSGVQTDLASAYQRIIVRKSKQPVVLPNENSNDARPDPGFRIFHVDSETGESREVPPYTTPGDFLQSIAQEKAEKATVENVATSPEVLNGVPKREEGPLKVINGAHASSSEYNEKTYDGYQDILEANSASTRAEELEAMRRARRANRSDRSSVDESKLD